MWNRRVSVLIGPTTPAATTTKGPAARVKWARCRVPRLPRVLWVLWVLWVASSVLVPLLIKHVNKVKVDTWSHAQIALSIPLPLTPASPPGSIASGAAIKSMGQLTYTHSRPLYVCVCGTTKATKWQHQLRQHMCPSMTHTLRENSELVVSLVKLEKVLTFYSRWGLGSKQFSYIAE